MNLYLVTVAECDYNEYDALVIRAANPDAAEAIARGHIWPEKNDTCISLFEHRPGVPGFNNSLAITVSALLADGPSEIVIGCGHAG